MTVNQLPPQAFSKDTLSKAFQWLMTQGPHIKELATSPDLLISLYQKAQLHGDEALERPSIQNFKNELKNLAGMMGELQPNLSAQVTNTAVVQSQPHQQFQTQVNQHNHNIAPQIPVQPKVPQSFSPVSPLVPQSTAQVSQAPETKPSSLSQLDAKSVSMIHEVKAHLNLSCEQEALRVLISLGYSKVKKIIS